MPEEPKLSPRTLPTAEYGSTRAFGEPGHGSRFLSLGGGTTRSFARQKSHSTASPAWRWRTGSREPEQERGTGTLKPRTPG